VVEASPAGALGFAGPGLGAATAVAATVYGGGVVIGGAADDGGICAQCGVSSRGDEEGA
jgi:hypothetical protein